MQEQHVSLFSETVIHVKKISTLCFFYILLDISKFYWSREL